MNKKIEICCDGAAMADLDDLLELQGELKSLDEMGYQRFRNEILETGYAFPIRVWKDRKKLWIVGGHQTKTTLTRMRDKEGFVVPKIPIVFVHAENITEAKRRVLQDISQYGKIQAQGLHDFMSGASLQFEDVYQSFQLPDFDMPAFETKFFPSENIPVAPPPSGADKLTSGAVPEGAVTKIMLYYTQSDYSKIVAAAAEISAKLGCSNLSQLFVVLLEKEKKR